MRNQREKNHEGFMHTPQQIPKRKVPKPPQEIHQRKPSKITKKEKQERHNQALRNHTESSIHTMKVHTRSSLSPDHPSLSQDLTMKLSSYSYENPYENRKGKLENKMS
jgi:hypothetical protein